jgi:hypothetical protein
MKRFLALLIFIPSLAFSDGYMYPSHVVTMGMGMNPWNAAQAFYMGITTTTQGDGQKSVTIAFGTGTEAAPTTSTTDGLRLDGIKGFTIHVEAGSAMTAGGLFLAYQFNNVTGNWTRVADGSLDLTASAVTKQSWSGFWVAADMNRITWVPSGIGVASTMYILGAPK